MNGIQEVSGSIPLISTNKNGSKSKDLEPFLLFQQLLPAIPFIVPGGFVDIHKKTAFREERRARVSKI